MKRTVDPEAFIGRRRDSRVAAGRWYTSRAKPLRLASTIAAGNHRAQTSFALNESAVPAAADPPTGGFDAPGFDVGRWRLIQSRWQPQRAARDETLFALANGSLGARGGFEESASTTQASFLAGARERTPIHYFEFARTTDTRVPVAETTVIRIRLGEDRVDPAGATSSRPFGLSICAKGDLSATCAGARPMTTAWSWTRSTPCICLAHRRRRDTDAVSPDLASFKLEHFVVWS